MTSLGPLHCVTVVYLDQLVAFLVVRTGPVSNILAGLQEPSADPGLPCQDLIQREELSPMLN